MPNALSANPPAPNPQPTQSPQASPLAAAPPQGPAPGQPAQQAPQAPPAPTHQQTVAALQHFDAIEQELTTLLKDPDLGKADMKSKIIDGTTALVSKRIITPAQAVMQLGSVPDRPFEQKQWLEMHFAQTIQGADAVLDHHGQAFAGRNVDTSPPNADNHAADMSSMMQAHYSPTVH